MCLYHPVTIGSLELPGNLFLAPVAGYTDRVFRSICHEHGAAFSFTELVSAESVARNLRKEAACGGGPLVRLLRRGDGETRYAAQLFGAVPERMAEAAAMLGLFPGVLGAPPDAVDINAGCPMPKVTRSGAGCALMKHPSLVGKIVEAVVRACRGELNGVPVTIKMRSGWDNSSINYIECGLAAEEAGAAMVSIHGRTRSQLYGGKSDWTCAAELAGRLKIPVAGSGDLYSPADARRMLRETGCAAVMFARGAMGNPFVFSSAVSFLRGDPWREPSNKERAAAALRHLETLVPGMGERGACLEMRKQFCAYTKNLRSGDGNKGFPGGAALRDSLVHAQSVEEYRKLFRDYGLL